MLLLQLMGEYGLWLRQRGHLPKVIHLGGGSGHMQSQSDWPQNASFNSVSVGTPALVPSDSVLRAWPCSGTLTERLLWTCGSRSAHVVPKTKPGGGTVSPIDPGPETQAGLLSTWMAVPHTPAHGAKGRRRGNVQADRQEEREGPPHKHRALLPWASRSSAY